MRNSKKRVRSCLSVILMFGMLLSYVPPVMAIDEVDEAVIAQEEPLETEDSSALEEEREDTEPPEPTKERDEETYSEETPVDSTSAREGSAEKMPVQKMPVQEMPVQEAPAEEAPAEEPASEEAFAEEGEQPEEILYTLTYSGLSDSAELEVRKLDPEDKDDADAISKLQKQLEEQELYDAFEISLTDGEILDEEAGARVTLHGYEVEDPEQTALYHFTDDGEIEELVYSAVDDEVSFVTKSFSPFVFAQAKEQEEQPDEALAEEQPDEAPAEEQPDEVPAEEQEQQALDLKMKNLLSTGADNGSDSDISIDTFRATLRSGATKNDSGDYVWTATNSYADHAFIFRVTYSLSGTYEYQPNAIEIRIPKSILLNRNGKSSDYYELSIPSYDAEGLTDANVFVYKEDGDDIVIYNRVKAPAAQNGYFEVSYRTSERTYEYADYDPSGTGTSNGNLNPKNGSDPFFATISIKQNGVEKTDKTKEIPVYIDTTAKITSTTKRAPTLYTTWNLAWGDKPADADDYYYLIWEVRSIISGTTQPYNFSLADNFNVTDGKVVGYRMQGQTGYTSNGTVENLKTDYEYGRYDYVLTRHLKETYDTLVAQNGRYTVTNTVTATVDPADQVDADTQAVSSRSWTYEAPTFERPTGHFYMYKWGLDYRDNYVYDSEDIRRFDLSDYLDPSKEMNTIPDLAYYTYVHGYPYPWTVPAGESMDDPASYGQKPVTYELIDNELYLKAISGSYTDQLTANDYQIDKITLDWYMQDAEYDDLNKRFFATSVTYTENDIITVYAQFNGGGDWVEIGTYNLYKNEGTATAEAKETYGVSFSGKDLVFANTSSICTGYKLVTSNAHYYTLLGAYPHVTLKSSDTVNQVVQAAQDSGQLKIALLNRDHGNVYKEDGTEEDDRIIGFVRNGIDYVIGVIKQGDIQKNVIGYRNDTVNRRYRITWSVEASESYQAEGNRRVYVNQESGTFYDLLPLGGVYVPDSVIAYADGVRLSDGQYSVKTVENYKNSGRTMLIVQYNVPADKYYFTYSTNHAWDVILEYGKKVLNSVAYETGNEDIGDGRPDDGGTITEKTLMANLDPATDANKFIYAQARHEINALMAGSLGLYKQVRAAQDTAYSYSTKTYSDSDYSYRIRFATDEVTVAKDLILFDSLENYTVAAGANAGATSDWHGTLTGFDLSVPEKLGIRPVVYYSTAKNLSIRDLTVDKNYNFADHSEIWVSAQDYTGNLSDVKAFAIDLRYDKKGKLYLLPTDTPVSVTVFMHSPKGIDSETTDPVAYNNIYLYNSVTDAENYGPDAVWSSKLNHQDYTQIRYRMVGDLKILKVDSTDKTTPVEGIVFRLWGTSHYGTEVDETVTTNRYGRITFKNIERGTYFLQEVDGVADYQQDHIQMTVTVDENGDVHIGVPEGGQDGTITYKTDVYGNLILGYDDDTKTYTIGNEPRIHGDLEFVKKVTKDDNLSWLPGVTFQLSGTSDYGNDILMLLTSDESGTVSIQNLELGSYEMTEIAVPDGIILSQTVYTVRCDSSGILSISYTDSEGQEVAISQDKSGDYVVVNEPTHSFTLWKMDPVNNESLPGATFTLTGTSDYETPVDMEVTSDANGMVTFDGLEPGSYVLKETVAPANHVLDDTPRVVTIESNGKVTIDGLTQLEETGWFPVENERSSEGVITITKAWSDSEAENHPIPVIHLDTEAPTHSLPVATIDKTLWMNSVNSYDRLYSATSFTQNTTATKEEVTASGSGWIRIDDQTTDYSIYFKLDGEAAYWWSDASIVYFPVDSSYMFYNCSKLTSLDLSGFDTSKATSMHYMFADCSKLTSLDVSSFDTSKVTNMGGMFQDCNKLTNLDLSSFNTSQVADMKFMFNSCYGLKNLDVSSWNTGNVTSMKSMFRNCSGLTSLNVSSFDTSNVTDMENMFSNCSSLGSLDLSSFDTSKVTIMSYMFSNCSSLMSLDVSSFDTSEVTGMSGMFSGCSSLTSLDLSSFNTSKVTSMISMFLYCSSLTSLDLSNFDTRKVTSMNYMFCYCESLTELDLSSFDTSKVGSMGYMLAYCGELKTIYASNLWSTAAVTTDTNLLSGCYELVGGNGTHYSSLNPDRKTYARIDKSGEPGYLTYKEAPSATPSTPTPGSHTAPAFSTPTPAKTAGENVAINQTSESKMYEGGPAESASAYNQWVDNGDGTWTYRFNVYDGDATYYIWEEALPGYTSDTDAEHPVEVTYTEGGTLTSEDDRLVDDPVTDEGGTVHHNYAVKITNTKDDGTTAALTVKKTVTGGTAADREKLFTFTVTLSDKSVTGYYGDMPFVKGVATVKLKHGQSATATGLPNGVGYTVVEKEAGQDGFTTTGTGETGTLDSAKPATAAFTNSKPDEPPPPPEPETGGLQVTKTVEPLAGEEPTDEKFTFTITLDDTGINGLYGDLIFKNGVATAYLAHGETVTVSGLPVRIAYTVKEETYKGYTTSYSGETGTIKQGETQAVTVKNTKEEVPANGFTLKKLVSGTPSAEPFTFFIDFAGLDPNSSYTYTVGEDEEGFTSAASGAARVSVKLNDNQTAVFDGLPVGSTYTVTESASGYVASYTVTNGSESGAIASPSGANRSSGETLQTGRETVDKDEQITVTFVNTSTLYDVSFIKYDSDGMFLDGALLQVLDSTGKVYAEWRSTGDIDTVQLPEGKYVLHEAEAPEGYTLAADITFTVGENGAVTVGVNTAAEVAMTDVETKVIISKEDGYGRPVAGAKLQIVDAAGNAVYSWVSGSEAREITGVLTVLTHYTLREVSAPNGYARAQDIPFILNSDGTVYIGDSVENGTVAENLTIVMNDYKSISLPLSGSRSELACMLFGCAMITAGGLYAARRRRREAKVRSNIGKRSGRICK